MNNSTPFLLFLLLALISGTLIIYKISKNNPIQNIQKQINSFVIPSPKNSKKNIPTPKPSLTARVTPRATPRVTPNSPIRKTLPTTQPKISQKENTTKTCYRFTVTHLDGSQSNLCYSYDNYQKLQSLKSSLDRAQSNYNFEKSVYEMYKEAYEKHSSDIYLKPMNEAKENMQLYQDELGELSLKMYNIESTGY